MVESELVDKKNYGLLSNYGQQSFYIIYPVMKLLFYILIHLSPFFFPITFYQLDSILNF